MRPSPSSTAACVPVALLLAASVLSACTSAAEEAAPRTATRDSAGIAIVETTRAAWSPGGGWRVDGAPRLRIGMVDGAAPYLLDRVVGATRLPDGRVVVGDGGSNQLRFFDSTGTFLNAVGREGGGPGEFEYLRALMRCGGDSLFAFDLSWQLSVFTASGALGRETTLHEPGSRRTPYALSCAPTGLFAITGWGRDRDLRRVGFYRTMTPVWTLDDDGAQLASLGDHLGSERLGTEHGSRPHPFGRSTSLAAAADAIYLGSGERFEVRRYTPDGRLERIQRAPPEDLSITPELVDAYRQATLARVSERARPSVERAIAEMPMPDALPAFVAMRVDADGFLWVQRFQPPGEERQRWSIFAPDGAFLGTLPLAPGFDLLEIGRDYLLGVTRDADGVQRVELYGLARGAG